MSLEEIEKHFENTITAIKQGNYNLALVYAVESKSMLSKTRKVVENNG